MQEQHVMQIADATPDQVVRHVHPHAPVAEKHTLLVSCPGKSRFPLC